MVSKEQSSSGSANGGNSLDSGHARLHQLGHKQELKRDLSVLSNFAFSFSIISVLTGITTLYNTGLSYGGPLAMTYGWFVTGFFTMIAGLSMAEICSYPTSGGLYYWSASLSGNYWAPFASWMTGWFNIVGQTEETKSADINGPKGIISAIGISIIAGWGYLLGITFAVTNIPYLLRRDNDAGGYTIAEVFYQVFKSRYGSGVGGIICLGVVAVAIFFCCMGSVTSNPRMAYAFSRDGAMHFQEMEQCHSLHFGTKLTSKIFQ